MTDTSTSDSKVASERRSLRYSVIANALIAVVGIVMALRTDSEAIMLDGLFNLVYVFVGLFTLKVAALVQAGDDAHFPMGYAYFEPLVNGIKGMLVLGISVFAFISAVQAMFEGGRPIAAGGAVLYGVFASIAGWIMAVLITRSAQRTQSPLLIVDAVNWRINGAISSAVLLAFTGTWFLGRSSYAHLAPYADPVVVLIVVVISISAPVRMAWEAMMEMLNRAPSKTIVDEVTNEVSEELTGLPVQELFVRVIQPGRTRMVMAHVVLPRDFAVENLTRLDEIRHRTLKRLEQNHSPVEVDLVFTGDPKWGAPRGIATPGDGADNKQTVD